MYKVNGVAMPTPKSFNVTISDLDGDSNRNINGDLLRDRIATKRKLEIEYQPLNSEKLSLVLKAISPVFINVEYPDPLEGRVLTKVMYAGDKSIPMYRIIGGVPKWNGLKFNLIEK